MSGFWSVLAGIDQLLLLLCLVMPFRRLRALTGIAVAFTAGLSLALLGSAVDFVPDGRWFPPLIETLAAVTIVYTALENIVYAAQRLDAGRVLARRWILAFGFGIAHGFGFAFALADRLQLAGDHPVAAQLGFGAGIAAGEVVALLVLMPALALLFRLVVPERLGIVIISALATHTAWQWMLARWEALAKFPFPRLDAALLASAMRGAMAMLILAGAVWLSKGLVDRWLRPKRMPVADPAANVPPGPG
jgi:hypothetical protein